MRRPHIVDAGRFFLEIPGGRSLHAGQRRRIWEEFFGEKVSVRRPPVHIDRVSPALPATMGERFGGRVLSLRCRRISGAPL